MEPNTDTLQAAETEVLDLIDRGVPAGKLELRHLSDETLLSRMRQANINWFAMQETGNKAGAEDMERNADSFLGDLQRRQQDAAQRSKTGTFITRCLKFGRQ